MNANINGSIDIAMGVPSHQYAATFAFYRSVVWLTPITGRNLGHRLCAGPNRIWIDEALQMGEAEIGLELLTDSFGGCSHPSGVLRSYPLRRDWVVARWVQGRLDHQLGQHHAHMFREPGA